MNPLTHTVIAWDVALSSSLGRRDLALIAIVGAAPDIDGAGLLVDALSGRAGLQQAWWFERFHHQMAHNVWAGLIFAGLAAVPARRRWPTFAWGLLVFHLHLLGDLVGSRGPDGYPWPIPYFGSIMPAVQLVWSGQWELNSAPNIVITAAALIYMLWRAWKMGFSPLWYLSARADAAVIATLRQRFGDPSASGTPEQGGRSA